MIKKLKIVLLCVAIPHLLAAQDIDLSNWKITIPAGSQEGKPISVSPPEIQNFETNETLKPYFYKDQSDSSLVFYAYPANSTRNSKYSRTEFREQMEPGSNNVNWTFEDGAMMRGTLSVPEITQKENGDYHRVIIMQIHGRLTNEQRDLIGEDDNNAPPMLKIYWDEGRIRVKTKVLNDPSMSDEELLHESAWGNDKGRNFKQVVGTEKFTLEVNIVKGKMAITLNDNETLLYEGEDIERWGIMENYFKAGNYFQSRDENSYAKVKYYNLEVSHNPDDITISKEGLINEISVNSNGLPFPYNLVNWKLELPSGYKAADWKLQNFQNDKFVRPFVRVDSLDESLIMEAFPSEGTSKAKYTRNTLKEQFSPGNPNVNWTMKKGGVLEAEFQMIEISKNEKGSYDKTLLVQIDGKTSIKQTKDLGLEKPLNIPFIKIYWKDERIYVTRKVLKDETTVGEGLLMKNSWKEDKGVYSREKVGFEKVKLRIEVQKNKVIIYINEEKPIIFRDMSVTQWYFENYFTVGNYLQSKAESAYCKVKFHKLMVTHEKKK